MLICPALTFCPPPVSDGRSRTTSASDRAGPNHCRQTYKELTPLIQQEYLGGPIFIGNQRLGISTLFNLDLRMDWTRIKVVWFSGSWFYKDLTDPIETVQRRQNGFGYTTVTNYDEGTLNGIELEVRQEVGRIQRRMVGSFGWLQCHLY